MMQELDRQSLWGAVIVSVAIIGASLILSSALNAVTEQLDRTAGRLDKIGSAVADAKEALANLPTAAAPRAAARRGADPDKRHIVKTDGAPWMGNATAAITIVEFSDFQ